MEDPKNPKPKNVRASSLQGFVLKATSVTQVLIIFFLLVTVLLEPGSGSNLLQLYIVLPLALIGLTYNLFTWRTPRAISKKTSSYIAFGLIAVELITLIGLTGGLDSAFFPALALILLLSCMLGLRAFFFSAGVGILSYIVLIIITTTSSNGFSLHSPQLFYILVSILFGWLIAKTVDQYETTANLAGDVTDQLGKTQMSERLMLSAIADPVIGLNDKMEITFFNLGAEDISHWDSASAQGVQLQNVIKLKDIDGKDMSSTDNPFLKVFELKKQVTSDRYYLLSKEKKQQAFSISIAPTFDSNNNVSGAIAVFHDISDEKSLQRERDEFVSTASHEMRTPVAAIEGYLSMASNDKLATTDARAKGFIEKAHNSSIHLGKLFEDLLSVTKIEDKKITDKVEVFNMSDLVGEVAVEMEIMAKQKGLSLLTHIGSASSGSEQVVAPLFEVSANQERIHEAMTNLVDNAIKYTQKGSVDIILSGDKTNVTFTVKDTGIGISADEQRHMFEKFYRVENSATITTGGTGLGLYITRNLVELYGGRIWVDSALGKGSSFSFSLPLTKV
jgi:signal transduction histidine kinase